MAHDLHNEIVEQQYTFNPRWRLVSFALMAIGLVGLAYGFITFGGTEHSHRLWANLLLNTVFFLGIGMAAAFFVAAHYLAWGGWSVVIKRVPEAIMGYIPVGAVLLLLVLIFGQHDLYHWSHHGIMDPNDEHYDPIIAGKQPYLNNVFFFARFAVFLGALGFVAFLLRRNSLAEDTGTPGDIRYHRRHLVLASIFIPIFAVYILVSAWDWLMSIDTHWFSTMYGWYAFASFWVTGIAVITLTVIAMKRMGYLPNVNENHLHDLGKYMFAFSIFWTYLTYCQYMLIWYANIPEETIYYQQRYAHYEWHFYGIFILNFVLPFLILMSRDAKRNMTSLTVAGVIIILGHFLDFYTMIMPGVVKDHAGWGPLEIMLPFLFAGIMIFITHLRLANAPLIAKNHPYLQESLHHEI
ncbi:MAG TPA: quinol:cytochrome C oxidoreductase [Chitinophagales bacterium]|nr:quinol:cytochrome C oxidoreductase [Chitinophagales bacterium]